MSLWAQTFRRENYHFKPPLKEVVVVIFEAEPIVGSGEDGSCEKFCDAAWTALFEQYPGWVCPYNQSKPPPNQFEKLRHSFCSPGTEGPFRELTKETHANA
jgi:hypothetical protein